MLGRDRGRLVDARSRVDVMPLGSGALAGSTICLDREQVAAELGFSGVTQNSMDAVSDRDYIAELLFALGLLGVHLSRLGEDIVLWSSAEFGFVRLSDAHTTGSSLMPQKKNPDIAELVRGKSGRLIGNLVALLVTLKGLPMTYNRDLQEDKEPLFDSIDTAMDGLLLMAEMITGMEVSADAMARAAADEMLLATDIADYLVRKGVPFRQSHEIVGKLTAHAVKENLPFSAVSLEQLREFSVVFEEDISAVLQVDGALAARKALGAPSPKNVAAQVKRWRDLLAESV
jgi:argininosuccinate lyase